MDAVVRSIDTAPAPSSISTISSVPSIDDIQQEIVDEFTAIDDALSEYELLLQYAASLPKMEAEAMDASHLVDGCQSKVWLKLERQDARLSIEAESDTLIIRGILCLLIKVLDKQPCAAIAKCNLFFLEKANLLITFDDTRAAGIRAIEHTIKKYCSMEEI